MFVLHNHVMSWDTALVLSYLKNLRSSESSRKFHSLKTVTLLTLSRQRVTLSTNFAFHKCRLPASLIIFNIPGFLKHSRHTKRDLMVLPLLISISLHEQHWQIMSYMMNFSSVIENHMDPQQNILLLGGYDLF